MSRPGTVSVFSADGCASAGKDAARAYGTGCFSTHLTHDLRGLSEDELKVRSKARTRALRCGPPPGGRAASRTSRYSIAERLSVHAQGVENWKRFYANSSKYVKVGRVSHPPIDPASPIPEHCDPKKAKARRSPEQVKDMKQQESSSSSSSSVGHGRSEL